MIKQDEMSAEKIKQKKGVVATVLVMIAVLSAGFAVQYYVWKVSYTVKPLTSLAALSIPTTSGSTSASDVLIDDLRVES